MFIHDLLIKLRPDLSVNDESINALCVELINKKSRYNLVNIPYIQPAGQIRQYEKHFENFFQKTKKAYRPIYIQGSLNLNLLDYQSCPKVNKYLNHLFQHSFISVVTRPIRMTI